jgi:hypothetical protein
LPSKTESTLQGALFSFSSQKWLLLLDSESSVWYHLKMRYVFSCGYIFTRHAGIFYPMAGNSNIMEDEASISSAKEQGFSF